MTPRRTARTVLLTAALAAAAAGGLAACTGPSTDASVSSFCDAMTDWWISQEQTLADGAVAAQGLGSVGTPRGTPERHRIAFEQIVAWGTDDEPDRYVTASVSDDVRDEIRDFDDWAQVTCSTGEVAEEGASFLSRD